MARQGSLSIKVELVSGRDLILDHLVGRGDDSPLPRARLPWEDDLPDIARADLLAIWETVGSFVQPLRECGDERQLDE